MSTYLQRTRALLAAALLALAVGFGLTSVQQAYADNATGGDNLIGAQAVSTQDITLEPGAYKLSGFKASNSQFNHFVPDSVVLVVDGNKATLRFITDGTTKSIQKYSKIALGNSEALVETSYDATLKDSSATVIEGVALKDGSTQESDPANTYPKYCFEIECSKADVEAMLDDGNAASDDIYVTLWNNDKSGWYKATNPVYLSLGTLGGSITTQETTIPPVREKDGSAITSATVSVVETATSTEVLPSGGKYTLNIGDKYTITATADGFVSAPVSYTVQAGDAIHPIEMTDLADGVYSADVTIKPSMMKFSGHTDAALNPRVVVSGENAWLVLSYRSSGGSAWRYSQMAWGSYDEVVAANKDGVCGAPTFAEGKSAADGLGDATVYAMSFAMPISKADLSALVKNGTSKNFTVRYVRKYDTTHDYDWYKPNTQGNVVINGLHFEASSTDIPADYSAVFEVFKEVPANLSDYTDESVAKLNTALSAVTGSPKKVADQAAVNEMAAAIENSIAALELKSAAAEKAAAEAKAAAEKAAAEKAAADKAAAEKAAAEKNANLANGTVKVTKTTYTYTGKALKPAVTVKNANGVTLKANTDYTVTYKNNKKVGTATVTVKGKGNYNGSKAVTFKIKKAANKVTVKKTSVKKSFTVAMLDKNAKAVALPKVTAKFGKAAWAVTAKDKKKVLSLKSGKIWVKKGAAKGAYTIKLKAKVKGTVNYAAAASKVVTVKVTVK